ncbi:MAG: hypothetical protein ACKOBN_02725 [Flavobacteriales bacterium]
MKRFKYSFIGLAFITALLFSSCTKEARITKHLWNNGGVWNIESFNAIRVSTYAPENYNQTLTFCGTFSFYENTKGNLTLNINGNNISKSLNYSNTEDQLALTIENKESVYNILDWDKKNMKMTISCTENFSNSNGSGTYTQTYILAKE